MLWKPLLIGIDYDETFTADPRAWRETMAVLRRHGHEFICVTRRNQPPADDEPPIPCAIVCAGDQWKKVAAERAGYSVDIWIDDLPQLIAPPLKPLDDWESGEGAGA